MKKPINNSDKPTSKNTQLDPLSDTNKNNPFIDGGDEFVLFPLDVQESNPITLDSVNSQVDDFILFPLDVNKTVANNNNPKKGKNTNPLKPRRQFVTITSPQISNIISQPVNVNSQPKKPTALAIVKPISNKTKILWVLLICLGFYTYFKKESSETYGHFFYSTIKNVSNSGYNHLLSFFRDENDFIEFKKNKKIIVTVPAWNFNEQRIESTYFDNTKGDSVIIISVNRSDIDRIEAIYMLNNFEDFKLNKIDTMWVLKSLLNPKSEKIVKDKIESKTNTMIGIFINYEWIENDMFTFKDEKGNEVYFTDVPENCIIYNKNGVNKNYYNKKFKIKWVVDNQSYEYPINKITQIELIN
jgi:hypothetical protein